MEKIKTISNVFNPQECGEFVKLCNSYKEIMKQPSTTTFGNRPPFEDITFDLGETGVPNRGYAHQPITEEILELTNILKNRYNDKYDNNWHQLFNCNLVHYSAKFPRGGSRGLHADNPNIPLGVVLIYSWGQARTLAIYRDGKIVGRRQMAHNSITAMVGQDFQQVYQHSVEKLPVGLEPGDRWSFNIRYF